MEWFVDCKVTDYPNLPSIKRQNEDLTLNTIRLLIEKDGFDIVTIIQVLNHSLNDEYYCANVLSIANVRKKWKNGLTAFESVAKSLYTKPKTPTKKPEEPNEVEYV
jgi:hypothetical protein